MLPQRLDGVQTQLRRKTRRNPDAGARWPTQPIRESPAHGAFVRHPSQMRATTPSVFLISRPAVDLVAMREYLEAVGGAAWLDLRRGGEATGSDAELLIEFGGRACYRSWEPGLNPNVSRIRTD